MNIIVLSNENMNKATIYHLTKSPEVEKMSEVSDMEEITVSDWCKYEEADYKDPEKVNTILAIRDENMGKAYATNSATFQRSFDEIVSIFGNTGYTIKVKHGTSKNGRDFITAVFQREV